MQITHALAIIICTLIFGPTGGYATPEMNPVAVSAIIKPSERPDGPVAIAILTIAAHVLMRSSRRYRP